MSTKKLTPAQREAKRLRDARYRANKKAKAAMAQKAAKTPSKASEKKQAPSAKKTAKAPQKPSKAPSCKCKGAKRAGASKKKVGGVIKACIALDLYGDEEAVLTPVMVEKLNLALDAFKHCVTDIVEGKIE